MCMLSKSDPSGLGLETLVLEEVVCCLCGAVEEAELFEIDGDTVELCSSCEHEHLKTCSCCRESFIDSKNDYAVDRTGEVYCEGCRDEHLSYCERCDEYSSCDDFSRIADLDEWWCDSCAEYHAYHCSECGNWTSRNHGDDNTLLCCECYERHYCICDDCNEVIHNDNAYYHDDGTYCESCYNENHSSLIHDYSYEPYLNFQSSIQDDETCLAYLGFELEAGGLSSSYDCKNIAESISDGEETFYLKEDGSIPEHGFELVSHPITLKRHKELNWQSVLAEMSSGGMRSHDLGTESCGLHVHVSRNYLSPYKWLLIDWFISKYQSNFEAIARRKETHWACFKKSNGQPVKDVYGKSSGTRYQAVNFENKNTVEFRLFRGTLKYSTFMATLEIIDALVHWAEKLSISDILATGDAFENFTRFIQNNGELYVNAVNYLTEKELI